RIGGVSKQDFWRCRRVLAGADRLVHLALHCAQTGRAKRCTPAARPVGSRAISRFSPALSGEPDHPSPAQAVGFPNALVRPRALVARSRATLCPGALPPNGSYSRAE